MAYNDNKIDSILSNEISKVPDRCEGYHRELFKLLVRVRNMEREHSIAATSVVKNIGNEVNKVGQYLYKKRLGNRRLDGDTR